MTHDMQGIGWRVRAALMFRLVPRLLLGLACAGALPPAQAADDCLPAGTTRAQLLSLKAAQWRVAGDAQRDTWALALLECMGVPDRELRDGFAMDALVTWIRRGALTTVTARHIGERALNELRTPDVDGLTAPFAAAVLGELARADRIDALWSPEEREAVLAAATDYLAQTRDYRGFDDSVGWRAGVSRSADLLMQLSLNPALERSQLDRVLAAVAVQVAPGTHAYVFAEGEHLARPVLAIARHGPYNTLEWNAWFQHLVAGVTPQPGEPTSTEMLMRLHNLKMFLLPMYASVQEGSDALLRERLPPALLAALRELPV